MRGINKTAIISGLIAFTMFGFAFALVPLYTVICKATGLNGKYYQYGPIVNSDITPTTSKHRDVLIQFVANKNNNLAWDFYPETASLHVDLEKNTKTVFYAKNNTNHTIIVQAIPSFAPGLAVKYFHKIQCFCFQKQKLKAHQAIAMPVIFRLDPQLPSDINTITLAYTLFDVTKG